MGKKLQLLSFVSANVAMGLLVLSAATNFWATRENNRLQIYEGLFKKCINHKHRDSKKCMKTYDGDLPPIKLLITMATLAVTAFLHLFVMAISIFLICNRFKYYKKTEQTLCVLEFFALLSSLTAVVLYTIYYDSNYYRLHWSYAVCWAGILCYFAALVMTIIHIDLAGKKESRQNVRYTKQGYWSSNVRNPSSTSSR